MNTATAFNLCASADGWSLHAPDSTDDDIANGDAPYIVSGEGEPAEADYAEATRLYDANPAKYNATDADRAERDA